jgi:hypothetical protein
VKRIAFARRGRGLGPLSVNHAAYGLRSGINLRIGKDRLFYGMKPIVIAIRGEYGFLFEGTYPRTYAFVPEDCVILQEDGSIRIDKMNYIRRQWAIRNMRFNSVDKVGTHLFPNERKLVLKCDAPEFVEFLDHLRRGYGEHLIEHPAAATQA